MSDRVERWGWRILGVLAVASVVMFLVGEIVR